MKIDLTRRSLLGIDLETTGTDVEKARIVSGAAVLWGGGSLTQPREWLSDVGGVEIPAGASAIHGIFTERARAEGRPAAEVVAEIVETLREHVAAGRPLVAMCAQFDFTILDRECARYGVRSLWDGLSPVVLDPYVLDRKVSPVRPGKRTLTALATFWCVKIQGIPHQAKTDATTACGVVHAIARRHKWVAREEPSKLHTRQIGWARAQQQARREFWARTGQPVDEAPFDWPLIPAPGAAPSLSPDVQAPHSDALFDVDDLSAGS